MKVYGMWYGGANYAYGYEDTDMEVFASAAAAIKALRSRADTGSVFRQEFVYVDGRVVSTLTPAVDLTSCIDLRDRPGGEPHTRLEFGPRGGVKVTPL